jgi:hypothetical protein
VPPACPRPPGGLRTDLQRYFEALGRPDGSVDFLDKYESDEEAATYLPAETDFEWKHVREDFLWEVLSKYGDLHRTEEEFNVPLRSTTYLSWWASKPREIVKKFRAKLRSLLLEAGVKLTKRRKSWPAKEKDELERLAEGAARLMAEKARDTTGADASKPPTRTAKSGGAKRSGLKRASNSQLTLA